MKLVIAAMLHETNTFSPVPTTLGSFAGRHDQALAASGGMLRGEAALAKFAGANVGFGGFVEVARAAGAEIVVPFYGNANPSAPVDRASFEKMCDAIVGAVRAGCDGVMLDLHGAMVAEGFDDAEAELVRRIRAVAPGVPLAVALDFHGNLSAAFFEHVDVVTGYRTYPHIDMRETGLRAGRTLLAMMRGEASPVIAWRWLPMMTHMNVHSPSREPMRTLMQRAIRAEADGEVLNASIFGGFPLADVPHTGFTVVVVGHDEAGAARLADELARDAWARREQFVFHSEPLADTIARAARLDRFPVVLADHGNNTASGGSTDTMEVLEEVLAQGLDGVVAGPFRDPQAVARLIEAGVGAEVTLPVGGRTDMPSIQREGRPLTVTGTVRAITDGRFVVTGPMATGVSVSMGRTVVLDLGKVRIVISEERVEPFDLGVFTHCGIDPRAARYILISSRQHFRAGFEPIAAEILMVAGPGVCSSDYSLFGYRRLTRPMYPLDADARSPYDS